MGPTPLFVGGSDQAVTVLFARLLACGVIAVAAGVLLVYLVQYVRRVLAEGFDYEWGCLAVVTTNLAADAFDFDPGIVDAVWLVGTVLVAGFLFNIAVTIRQQEGEVERLYDQTTWRQRTIEE